MQSEGTPPEEAFNPKVKRSGWKAPEDTGLWKIADIVEKKVRLILGFLWRTRLTTLNLKHIDNPSNGSCETK